LTMALRNSGTGDVDVYSYQVPASPGSMETGSVLSSNTSVLSGNYDRLSIISGEDPANEYAFLAAVDTATNDLSLVRFTTASNLGAPDATYSPLKDYISTAIPLGGAGSSFASNAAVTNVQAVDLVNGPSGGEVYMNIASNTGDINILALPVNFDTTVNDDEDLSYKVNVNAVATSTTGYSFNFNNKFISISPIASNMTYGDYGGETRVANENQKDVILVNYIDSNGDLFQTIVNSERETPDHAVTTDGNGWYAPFFYTAP